MYSNAIMGANNKKPETPILPPPKKRVKLERGMSFQGSTSASTELSKSKKTTSLLLARWLASGGSGSAAADAEDGCVSEDRCMQYGTPPPVEEPHCYTTSLNEGSDSEKTNCKVRVSPDSVKTTVSEHVLSIVAKDHLLQDLELGRINAENITTVLETCKTSEVNALLLYASFLGHSELIPYFHKAGANLNYAEPKEGLTALHLCAFGDSLTGAEYLVDNGANVNSRKIYTPFQYAAFGNSYRVAKYFISKRVCQENPGGDDTVLHAAAKNNALQIIELLAPNNPALHMFDCIGYAPIHYVADRGYTACLEALLQAGCQVDIATREGDTALHLAAGAGESENLEILLNAGAYAKQKNHKGQTALHLAAKAHSLESVEVLLLKGSSDPNTEDNDGRTSLHVALGKSVMASDVSECLIAWKADVNKADNYGYTPLHAAAINQLSQCVKILIQRGGDLSAKTKGGTTALSVILRKTPTSLNGFEQLLDSSICLYQNGTPSEEVELRLNFHPLLQHRQEGEIAYLGTFVKEGYKDILEHPLCRSFLYLKWQKIRKYYVGRLLFYLVYVFVLTAWVMTALALNCYNETRGIIDNGTTPLCKKSGGLDGFLYQHPKLMEFEWYALTILTVIEALRKLAGISSYVSLRQFFTQIENLVEWCVVPSVFATCLIFTGRTYPWQSHVGAYAVLCGWVNLMLMIGQLPMFGAYVAMFTSIQAQVFKLLLAYACLLVGFTASFCVIFSHSKSFSSPHTGLIKVLVMMTGELDFEDLLFPSEGDEMARISGSDGIFSILLQFFAQLCFLLFLLFVTIVLMNLLIGIVVNDINGLQKTAGLAKLVRQTKLISDVETPLFLGLLPRRLMMLLRWTALVPPSSLRVVLTVRPLNPRENRLPREILAAAHKFAKDRKFLTACGTLSSKRSNSTAYTYLKSDGYSTMRRDIRPNDFDIPANENIAKIQQQMGELKEICDQNQKLIQDLVMALAMADKRCDETGHGEQL